MEESLIVAMAVAAIAEENGVDTNHVIVRSFKEAKKSSLEQYIEDNKIDFSKMPKGFKTPKLNNMKRISARTTALVTKAIA